MYCDQCGKRIAKTSKFCSGCGSPVLGEENVSHEEKESILDPVKDIQKKLREIDNRKKPPKKKENTVKKAFDVLKGKVSILDLVFDDDFESQKMSDKKKLILEYPMPNSCDNLKKLATYMNSQIASNGREIDSLTDVWKEKLMRMILDYPIPKSEKQLEEFVQFINSEIESRKRTRDVLTIAWKEKLKQVHSYTKTKAKNSKAHKDAKKYYSLEKRRDLRYNIRDFVPLLMFFLVPALILSILYKSPWGLFGTVLGIGWGIFLLLFVYGCLDSMIDSIKTHSAKQKVVPKIFRVVAWIFLIPYLSGLIVSIAFHYTVLIPITAVLFGVDVFFLLIFLLSVYDL